MLLSKACAYGLRAALYLSTKPTRTYVSIRSISDALGIPYHFLAKIIQTLAQHGILISSRGPGGGVALSRSAAEISLKQIVLTLEGPAIFTDCVLGLPGCNRLKPCPLHEQWAPSRDRMYRMFERVSLAEMAERMEEGDFRLVDLSSEAE